MCGFRLPRHLREIGGQRVGRRLEPRVDERRLEIREGHDATSRALRDPRARIRGEAGRVDEDVRVAHQHHARRRRIGPRAEGDQCLRREGQRRRERGGGFLRRKHDQRRLDAGLGERAKRGARSLVH